MADVGEHPAPGLVDVAQRPVPLLELDGALLHLALEIGARVVQLCAAPLHFGDHPVEADREIGQLVAPGHPHPVIQPAARDLAGAFDQSIDRRLNLAAHPERRQPGAGGRDGDHDHREQRQAPGQRAGLRVGSRGFSGFVVDHLVDQRAELAIEHIHVATQRRRIASRPVARHGGNRLIKQSFEAVDTLELEALLGFGFTDKSQLVERQPAQSFELFAEPVPARLQLCRIDRLTKRSLVTELLEVPVRLQGEVQIGLDLGVRQQAALQPQLHLARGPVQQKPHDDGGTEQPEEGDEEFGPEHGVPRRARLSTAGARRRVGADTAS